jgi:hypothetical protein
LPRYLHMSPYPETTSALDPGQWLVALEGPMLPPDQLACPLLRHAEYRCRWVTARCRRAGLTSFPPQLLQRPRSGAPCRPRSASTRRSRPPAPTADAHLRPSARRTGPPAMIGGLTDLQLFGDLRNLVALGEQPISLPESPAARAIGHSYQADQSQGVRSSRLVIARWSAQVSASALCSHINDGNFETRSAQLNRQAGIRRRLST